MFDLVYTITEKLLETYSPMDIAGCSWREADDLFYVRYAEGVSLELRAEIDAAAASLYADRAALEAEWQTAEALKITTETAPRLVQLLVDEGLVTQQQVVQYLTGPGT